MKRALLVVLAIGGVAWGETCQITSPLPMPVSIAGCTFSGNLPSGSTSYVQNTLSPTTTSQQFTVQNSSVSSSETLGFIGGTQCLHSINGAVSGTGSDCGSGGGGGTWGSITGTLSNQTDLQSKFNGVSTSTNSLQTQITATGVSTGSLQSQETATAVATGTLAGNFPVKIGSNTIGPFDVSNTSASVTGAGGLSVINMISASSVSITINGAAPAALTDNPLSLADNSNTFFQINMMNRSAGNNASGDYVATSNLGSNTSNYINLGINGSGFNQATQTVVPSTWGYLYTSDEGLAIGAGQSGIFPDAAIVLYTSNPVTANERIYISNAGAITAYSSFTITNQLQVINSGVSPSVCISTSATGSCQVQVSSAIATGAYDYLLTVSSAAPNSTMALGVQNCGHIISSGTTPTASSCGTSPVINGTDNSFTVSPGATATGCTITFATPFLNNPVCIAQPQTESLVNAYAYTHSSTNIVITQTGASSITYDVLCIGQKQ